MKKRYKFLIGNFVYLTFFGMFIYYNYTKYGWSVDWTYPTSMSFTLGLFMFNLIPFIAIMLSADTGDVG
jgi:hypothetical protein